MRHRLLPVFLKASFDALLAAAAWVVAFWLRFDPRTPPPYGRLLDRSLPLVVAVSLLAFAIFGLYGSWWRYTSLADMWRLARGATAAAAASAVVVYLARPVPGFPLPRSVALLYWLLLLALVCASRLVSRSLREHPYEGRGARGRARGQGFERKDVLVVGAGDAGQLVVRELERSTNSRYRPLGYVDDDPRKQKARFQDLKVLGTVSALASLIAQHRPDEILVAIPSASGELKRRVAEAARASATPVKTLPNLHELLAGDLDLARQIRPLQVEDLLGRDPVEFEPSRASYLRGAVVLVSGAGGSIGSELCRQVSKQLPERLILLDRSEAALYEIERELKDERRFQALDAVLGDCGDEEAMAALFAAKRPTIVIHAAAYKHVPLLEDNPLQAVSNNVIATRRLARAAAESGVERFLLISTDKASRPSSLMGRTKAVCEWIVESQSRSSQTRFVAVRFGNVLGSSGSVIPLFRRQLEAGGPLTVTHPDMTRYFMTISEAVALVIQAGALGRGGEIFVLDMGEPVRILDLARNMIRLSGADEVEVSFSGPRPGEKLVEELWEPGEDVLRTAHPKLLRSTRAPVSSSWLEQELDELERLVARGDSEAVRARLSALQAVRNPVNSEPSRPS